MLLFSFIFSFIASESNLHNCSSLTSIAFYRSQSLWVNNLWFHNSYQTIITNNSKYKRALRLSVASWLKPFFFKLKPCS